MSGFLALLRPSRLARLAEVAARAAWRGGKAAREGLPAGAQAALSQKSTTSRRASLAAKDDRLSLRATVIAGDLRCTPNGVGDGEHHPQGHLCWPDTEAAQLHAVAGVTRRGRRPAWLFGPATDKAVRNLIPQAHLPGSVAHRTALFTPLRAHTVPCMGLARRCEAQTLLCVKFLSESPSLNCPNSGGGSGMTRGNDPPA